VFIDRDIARWNGNRERRIMDGGTPHRTAPHQELGVSFSFSFPLKVAVLEYPHDEILFLQQDGM